MREGGDALRTRPTNTEDNVTASHQQTHQAGRHLAVAQALLQGLPARIVGQQTHIEVNGHPASVMVAGKGAWMIADVDAFTSTSIETYVLVDVSTRRPDVYIAPGEELRGDVRQRHDEYMSRVGTRPRNPDSKHTKIEPAEVKQWKSGWKRFD